MLKCYPNHDGIRSTQKDNRQICMFALQCIAHTRFRYMTLDYYGMVLEFQMTTVGGLSSDLIAVSITNYVLDKVTQ